MENVDLIYAPRAQRDLLDLPRKFADQILNDHDLLKTRPWPNTKVKKIKGHPYWELKTGDYRSLFIVESNEVVFLRIVNRKNLETAVKRIDLRTLWLWLRDKG
ncbi:MAG: type II toxin-antitoxin system RelE/ParE family toxin [Nitrospirae bacterium]|nr:type II toxin-antitoxin system RelE/ParE family toxin [Nitrospirota bacterium]